MFAKYSFPPTSLPNLFRSAGNARRKNHWAPVGIVPGTPALLEAAIAGGRQTESSAACTKTVLGFRELVHIRGSRATAASAALGAPIRRGRSQAAAIRLRRHQRAGAWAGGRSALASTLSLPPRTQGLGVLQEGPTRLQQLVLRVLL